MTELRKTTKNINQALADPATVYGFQTNDKTRTVLSVRRTRTGRPIVTFSDGTEARYTGTEDVIVLVPVEAGPLGKPTHTGPYRGWTRTFR